MGDRLKRCEIDLSDVTRSNCTGTIDRAMYLGLQEAHAQRQAKATMTTKSHKKRMYPVFDIPLPSPSLKKTQRETNFLSRN